MGFQGKGIGGMGPTLFLLRGSLSIRTIARRLTGGAGETLENQV